MQIGTSNSVVSQAVSALERRLTVEEGENRGDDPHHHRHHPVVAEKQHGKPSRNQVQSSSFGSRAGSSVASISGRSCGTEATDATELTDLASTDSSRGDPSPLSKESMKMWASTPHLGHDHDKDDPFGSPLTVSKPALASKNLAKPQTAKPAKKDAAKNPAAMWASSPALDYDPFDANPNADSSEESSINDSFHEDNANGDDWWNDNGGGQQHPTTPKRPGAKPVIAPVKVEIQKLATGEKTPSGHKPTLSVGEKTPSRSRRSSLMMTMTPSKSAGASAAAAKKKKRLVLRASSIDLDSDDNEDMNPQLREAVRRYSSEHSRGDLADLAAATIRPGRRRPSFDSSEEDADHGGHGAAPPRRGIRVRASDLGLDGKVDANDPRLKAAVRRWQSEHVRSGALNDLSAMRKVALRRNSSDNDGGQLAAMMEATSEHGRSKGAEASSGRRRGRSIGRSRSFQNTKGRQAEEDEEEEDNHNEEGTTITAETSGTSASAATRHRRRSLSRGRRLSTTGGGLTAASARNRRRSLSRHRSLSGNASSSKLSIHPLQESDDGDEEEATTPVQRGNLRHQVNRARSRSRARSKSLVRRSSAVNGGTPTAAEVPSTTETAGSEPKRMSNRSRSISRRSARSCRSLSRGARSSSGTMQAPSPVS